MIETRYNRQMLVNGIREAGQLRLANARVGVVGVGALGCSISDQIVRAGFGYVRLIDPDTPEISNLQRQVLIDEDDVKNLRPKALAAGMKLRRANSEVVIEEHVTKLTKDNTELLSNLDLVLDGTDNFEARYLINDICVKNRTPWIYGGVLAAQGMSFPVLPDGPCLRCALGPNPPVEKIITTSHVGVLCSIVATIASLEVVRAIKLLTGKPFEIKLTIVDLWEETMRSVKIEKDTNCPVCGA